MEKIRILLVDDDRQNSEFLRKFLEVEGYEVSYAENGGKGWETFSAIRPDLVLLDVNMPVKNGFELAQLIRERDRDVIIFFLTDRTEKADRLKGFDLKGNDYIPKPFYPEELIAKIKERFEHRQPIKNDSNTANPHFLHVSPSVRLSLTAISQRLNMPERCSISLPANRRFSPS